MLNWLIDQLRLLTILLPNSAVVHVDRAKLDQVGFWELQNLRDERSFLRLGKSGNG